MQKHFDLGRRLTSSMKVSVLKLVLFQQKKPPTMAYMGSSRLGANQVAIQLNLIIKKELKQVMKIFRKNLKLILIKQLSRKINKEKLLQDICGKLFL